MKTKLEMAHEWAMKHGDAETVGSRQNMVKYAWEYADAMQVEADKRNKAEAEQKRNAVREMLNADNTFLEKEGQHFDDVADMQKPYTSSEEWQPDWSQAPEWATHFFCERDEDDQLNGYFAKDKRGISIDFDIQGFDGYGRVRSCKTFNYQGDWRESLRKRPQ